MTGHLTWDELRPGLNVQVTIKNARSTGPIAQEQPGT
jgi:hypothetical protein